MYCLNSVLLYITANSKLNGARTLANNVIELTKYAIFKSVFHRLKKGKQSLMLSVRHAKRKMEKYIISVDCVFSNSTFIYKNVMNA